MTRLIHGHDLPDTESVQVTGLAEVVARALTGAVEQVGSAPSARRIALRAVPAEPGAPASDPSAPNSDPTCDEASPERGPSASPDLIDTPGATADPPIGSARSTSGDPAGADAADPTVADRAVAAAAVDSAADLAAADLAAADSVAADYSADSAGVELAGPEPAAVELAAADSAAIGPAAVGRAAVDDQAAADSAVADPAVDFALVESVVAGTAVADGGAAGGASGATAIEPPTGIASALWAEYRDSRGGAARDRLVVHYRALVRGVAAKLAAGLPTHVDVADLAQVGMFGLLDAVERFDPAREVRFETYAAQRIRGAMLDELRAQDWVPRTARARRREAERARERLEVRLGRTATESELAVDLGIAVRELRGVLHHRMLVSVEALEAGTGGQTTVAELVVDDRSPDPVELVEQAETVRELASAVGSLGDRDREVVRLYYVENRTLAEIGTLLGVTESRVCQLHSRLVTRLRTRLTEAAAG